MGTVLMGENYDELRDVLNNQNELLVCHAVWTLWIVCASGYECSAPELNLPMIEKLSKRCIVFLSRMTDLEILNQDPHILQLDAFGLQTRRTSG